MEEFKKLTGIGVGSIQDISIFDAPQRAMAEALSRSPQFDFFHIDFEHDPVARIGRAARAARRVHEEGEFQDRRGRRLCQLHDLQGQHLRHHHRRQRAHPLSAQGPGRGSGQPEAVRRQARQEAGVPADLGGRPAHPAVPPQSGEGHHRLWQPAQPRERRDLVVHDVLLRRRLPVRRRHEPDAEHRSRQLCRRRLPAGKEVPRIRNRPDGAPHR